MVIVVCAYGQQADTDTPLLDRERVAVELASSDSMARRRALERLYATDLEPGPVEARLAELMSSTDATERLAALRCLLRTRRLAPGTIEAVDRLANDAADAVREEVCWAIDFAYSTSDSIPPSLHRLIDDEVDDVACSATIVAAYRSRNDATFELRIWRQLDDASAARRILALRTCYVLRPPPLDRWGSIERALRSEHAEEAFTAISVVEKFVMQDDAIKVAVAALLESPDQMARVAAARALGRICTSADVVPIDSLTRVQSATDEALASAAVTALARIGRRR